MSATTVSDAHATTWWPARRGYALLAMVAAGLTTALVIFLGGPDGHRDLALLYVVVVATALVSPALITVQVLAGQLLVASLLPGRGAIAALLLLPAVVGVIATAEILAVVARLDSPIERHPGDDLGRASGAAVVGGGIYAAVVLLAGLPGPTGLVAVGLASAACAVLATLLSRR